MKLALLLPLLLAAADPVAVLSAVRKAYTSSPSSTSRFVQTYAPAGFAAASPEAGSVTLQAPDLVRFDYDGPEGKTFTFDGKAARQYVAADRQMIIRTLRPGDKEKLPLLFLESPEAVLSRFTVTAAEAAGGIVELKLDPKAASEAPRILLSVGASGEVTRLVVTDAAGNRTTFTFSDKAAGPRRPASDFALKPPAGTKILAD
ncbi:MAG: outer membrane lipoprotein carrier protein LolA [Thermoanaerobaculia bacterium]